MEESFLRVATLDEKEVAMIRTLEAATGKHIMAFEPGLQIADLNEEQLQQVRSVEETLGVTLLVFEP